MTSVWKHILNHVKFEISEWSLWIIFLGLQKNNFFEFLYNNVDSNHQLLLLDIISQFLEEEPQIGNRVKSFEDYQIRSQSHNHVTIPNDCVRYIINLFKNEIMLLELAKMNSEDKICIICKLNSLLVKISSIDYFREIVQQDK